MCHGEYFQNILQHQSLEELSLSSLYQLQGLLVGQFQLPRQSFADQLEIICETHINICNLMGITYIVYWSGHFSRKAAKIFLRCTAVIPFVTALGTTEKQRTNIGHRSTVEDAVLTYP